jgi:hypothetical protein
MLTAAPTKAPGGAASTPGGERVDDQPALDLQSADLSRKMIGHQAS